jgi:predicted phosphoribosyltransferase
MQEGLMAYANRTQAGKRLAEHLGKYRGEDALVLALPRGGVEVGLPVAEALDAELDVLVVRKLGAPQNPEFGLGAIASYGARYVDEDSLQALGLTADALEQVEQRERQELHRRQQAYRDELPPPRIEGRTVIVVDDGVATGGTVRAAIRAIRQLKPGRLVLAVPVAPPDTARTLVEEVDELVCPETPSPFRAIGLWYAEFDQTTDGRVIELLRRGRSRAAGPSERPSQ